jgi:uncharacterized membrane protein YkvA (DUF1232 family)
VGVIAKLRSWAGRLKRDVAALFLAYRRKDTPLIAKAAAALTVGYALSPVDIIPDFIPVLGYLDDLVLLPLLIALCVRLIPREILEQCRMKAQDLWRDGKPKSWKYAVPIVLFWVLILGWIAYELLW